MKPPKDIPRNLIDEFTLNGRIKTDFLYKNEIFGTSRIYTKSLVDQYICRAKKMRIKPESTVRWLDQAFEKYLMCNNEIVVVGSTRPLFEALCLLRGSSALTIEFKKIISMHPMIRTETVSDFYRSDIKYQAAISISSYEHTGLGRYGDPIDPEGDFKAMRDLKTKMKKGGLLFLSVPVGKDLLVWNAHRIYGGIRLPFY
jgi:hypothetical protein